MKIDQRCPYRPYFIKGRFSHRILNQATNSDGAISLARALLRLKRLHNHHLRVLRRDVRHINHESSSMSHNVAIERPSKWAKPACEGPARMACYGSYGSLRVVFRCWNEIKPPFESSRL